MHTEDLAKGIRKLENELESEKRQAKKQESEIKRRWSRPINEWPTWIEREGGECREARARQLEGWVPLVT